MKNVKAPFVGVASLLFSSVSLAAPVNPRACNQAPLLKVHCDSKVALQAMELRITFSGCAGYRADIENADGQLRLSSLPLAKIDLRPVGAPLVFVGHGFNLSLLDGIKVDDEGLVPAALTLSSPNEPARAQLVCRLF